MNSDDEAIAIVAMDCRLPGAQGIEEFWRRLNSGECVITDVTDAEISAAGVPHTESARPDYVKRAGILAGIDEFDASYFGYSSREADSLDVQQRLTLQMAVSVLEQANIDPLRTDRRIGVFAGSALSSYLFGVLRRKDIVESLGEMAVRHGNDKDFLATRISYKLNLRGPSVAVQTACSTGVVAVHSAVQSLILHECDAALAGATYVRVPQHAGYRAHTGGVLSSDGKCRPFDAAANGTVFTNGLGLVLLKRLNDAIADGDHVYAVIAGSAVNNDGAAKVSFTAPSVSGQVDALQQALDLSGARSTDISYIEAHGTGTSLGDPIEIEAIKQVYGDGLDPCGIGSLKGNFGHLNIAAGIIGLIKAALVLDRRFVPPTINVTTVNPALGLDGTRFHISTEGRRLDHTTPHWVGVSAFGMGGTNGHVILRSFEQEPIDSVASERRASVLTVSAKSATALRRHTSALADHLNENPELSLAECAHTLQSGRSRHPFRASLAASNVADAATQLREGHYHTGMSTETAELAFVFSGQGTQAATMGQTLARHNSRFCERLEQTFAVLNEFCDFDATHLLRADIESQLTDTAVAQPFIFGVEYALATTLIDAGVLPRYLLGHSLGELVAASVAGVFDLATAAEIVAKRAELMAGSTPGSMLGVDALESFADLIADDEVVVAARNAPRQFVLAGSNASIERAIERASSSGVRHHRLATSHAFHSPSMRDASASFLSFLRSFDPRAPKLPVISNITGRILTEYEARSPHYWADHLVRSVDFTGSVETLRDLGVRRFVEIGHGRAMSNIVRANFGPATETKVLAVSALGDLDDEDTAFADAVALAWSADPRTPIEDLTVAERFISLPTYSFDTSVHWVKPVDGFAVATDDRAELPDPVVVLAPAPVIEVAGAPSMSRTHDVSDVVSEVDEEIKQIVGSIFEASLGETAIATDLSFFELGGNSLMAIQLINSLRDTFKMDISVRDFDRLSSISGISQLIESRLVEEAASA